MRILDSKASGFEEEVLGFKQRAGEVDKKTVKVVEKILGRIRAEGDPALFELTRKFDRVTLDRTNVEIARKEIERSEERVDPQALASLRASAARILAFHEKQKDQTWTFTDQDGVTLGQIVRPLQRVG
ncbi:MAG: histidinol dehydrogenase, partial [Nitrospirae bacterium CG_4_10_14_3_um_filter_53_41]